MSTWKSRIPRLYLAGPDVFLPNAVEMGERKKDLCAQYGFEGVYPFDSEANIAGLAPRDAGLLIGRTNEQLIKSCDAVVANITPFRGPSADVGTVYEMGYAHGRGLRVFAYSNDSRSFTDRTADFWRGLVTVQGDRKRDPDGMAIEEWGLVDNLMIESCIAESGGGLVIQQTPVEERYTGLQAFIDCLRLARKIFAGDVEA